MASNQELIDNYINHYRHSKQSQSNRKSSLKYFFGEDHFNYQDKIFDITTKLLVTYFEWLKNLDTINITTKRNKWTILISFLNYTMELHQEFLIKIPQKTVNWRGCNGNRKEIKEIASKEEIEQILKHFKLYNVKHYLIFRLFTETGMRKGELINAKYTDLNVKERYVRATGKTEEVVYYFSKELAKQLNQYLSERKKLSVSTEALFITQSNKKYSNRVFNVFLKKVCKKLGIEKNITCHTFRRTLNTYRKKIGCSNEDRKILLNHKVNDVNIESYLVMNREEYLLLFDQFNPYLNLNL